VFVWRASVAAFNKSMPQNSEKLVTHSLRNDS